MCAIRKVTIPLLTALSSVFLFVQACASENNNDALQEKLQQVMTEQVENGFWGVVYVSQGGEVLLREGYGMADRKNGILMPPDAAINSASLSKQVTAAAALKLVEEGKLSLSDTLSMYFNNVPDDKADITVKQLLSHTGGIEPWVYTRDHTSIPQDVWLNMVFSTPLKQAPGEGYIYANDGITLVAIIIERVTGKPYQTYLREALFKPLGMTKTGWPGDDLFRDPDILVATSYNANRDVGAIWDWPPPSWALLGNGGIVWTVDDMATWHKAVHGDLLPAELREQLFEPIVEDPERFLYPTETEPMYYGLAWRIGTSLCGDTRISHTGTGFAHHVDYRYYRDRDILIYVASNKIDVNYAGDETKHARRAAEALSLAFMADCQ